MTDLQSSITSARKAIGALQTARAEIDAYANESIAALAGIGERRGLTINRDAAERTFQRPYTIFPQTDPNEIIVVQSLIVADLPAVGWILSDDGAFRVSRVTRTMNLMGSLPEWVQLESGWAPPEHAATVDPVSGIVTITSGDRSTFRERYGRFLGKPNAQGYALRSAQGFIGLVAQLMRDGISPHVARPLDPADWDASAECDIELRDYQRSSYETFAQFSGVSMFAPTGAGKMFSMLYLAAHLRGRGYIFVPTINLVEDWQREIALHAPKWNGKVVTYAWAFAHLKELQRDESIKFLGFDELHRLPAKEWSRLAFLRNRKDIYVTGATASPYREDGGTFMVMSMCGPVAAVPWQPLIARGILNKPKSEARIFDDEPRKFRELETILAAHPNERVFIFCETLDKGKELSRELGIPFVSGEVHENRRALVESSKHCILSVVGELGISFKDLRIVVEYDVSRTGKSRSSSLQRHGRLMHSLLKNTSYLVLFTLDEYHKFGDRLNGIRQELGDVLITDLTGKAGKSSAKKTPMPKRSVIAIKPGDEAGTALAHPAVAKLLDRSYAKAPAQVASERKLHAVLKLGWDSPVSLEELSAGKGLSARALTNYKAAFKIAEHDGLMTKVGEGWLTNKGKLQKVIDLARRFK